MADGGDQGNLRANPMMSPVDFAANFSQMMEHWQSALQAGAERTPTPSGSPFSLPEWSPLSRLPHLDMFRQNGFGRKSTQNGVEDSYAATAFSNVLDRSLHALIGRATGGISPLALSSAMTDWLSHLAISPGKQVQIGVKAFRKALRLAQYAANAVTDPQQPPCIEPLAGDFRFAAPEWQQWPYNMMSQSFLLSQQWWHIATTGVRGMSARNEAITSFMGRQALDVFSPSNYAATNPEVIRRSVETAGMNFVQGWMNFLEDWQRLAGNHPPVGVENFPVGKKLAITPGKVVFRNRLIELIQYEPTTKTVRPQPVLITPAWIMKYYILDLQPHNSLIRHLVDRGYSVFCISWKNPTPEDRDLGLQDYVDLGFRAALDAVNAIVPKQKVHTAGYCLGGTLLSIATAASRHDEEDRIASMTLFAAQTDFEEAGELTLFITDSQLAMLDDMMWEQGFLDTTQMAGAFQMLRSNDLIFSHNMKTYLMGEREEMNDLMAWNADGTRMPYRMHSEYLRKLFLDNDLASGRLIIDEHPLSLTDIDIPVFAVGTERDHIAPWKSVFKIHRLADTDVTFALAKGGHNGGIVSEPGHPRRHYRIHTHRDGEVYLDPDTWLETAELKEGSWWTAWFDWLDQHSGEPVKPPSMGTKSGQTRAIMDAPGKYVMEG